MSDIVERLRREGRVYTHMEAADEIERLRGVVDRTVNEIDELGSEIVRLRAERDELLRDARQLQEGHNAAWERYSTLASELFSLRAERNEAVAALALYRAENGWLPGRYQSEAEQERDELFNRLGRVTEELGLSMDVTASRIIEVIRERVDDEREACASVSVRVEVPPGAETWSPLEAWEEALTLFDEAFREAVRARGDV
jgi:chromosome segregation ATPase